MTRERGWPRRVASAVAALTVAMSVPACGPGDSPAGQAPVDERNPMAIFQGESLGLIDYAQLKLRNECLAKAGYAQNLDTMMDRPIPAFEVFVITPRTFGPTTAQEARRIGFGRDESAEPPPVVSSDPNYDRTSDACSEKAWDRLGDDVQKAYYAYFDLGNKLGGTLMKSINARLDKGLPAKMLACVKGKGYQPDDEQQFLKTPRPQLLGVPFGGVDPAPGADWQPKKQPGTIEIGPAVAARPYHPTPEESDLAVAWLECRTDTTLAAQQMAAAIAVQKEMVAENETTFTELNPKIKRAAKQAAALVGTR